MPPDARLPRRNAAALKPPRFPILPFDEWRISFARGSVFNLGWLMPGESLVSILWKFACANALPSHALLDLISPEVDPHEGVAPVRDVVDLAVAPRAAPALGCVAHIVAECRAACIADSAQRTVTTACCISGRMNIAVPRITNRCKRAVLIAAVRRLT